jgi:hypothetical protein
LLCYRSEQADIQHEHKLAINFAAAAQQTFLASSSQAVTRAKSLEEMACKLMGTES